MCFYMQSIHCTKCTKLIETFVLNTWTSCEETSMMPCLDIYITHYKCASEVALQHPFTYFPYSIFGHKRIQL